MTLPPPPAVNDVAFPDARHGWLAGDGQIVGTSDGGRSWRVEWHDASMIVTEVLALDASHAWAFAQRVATDGTASHRTVLRTEDGVHWTASRVPHTLFGLTFTSARSGWAIEQLVPSQALLTRAGVGEGPGDLAYTGDGGRSWAATGVRNVDAVCFDGARLGWAVGLSGVWSTVDGGRGWHRVGPEPGRWPLFDMSLACRAGRLWLLQDLMGAATGHEDYAGWTSDDGGRRWRQVLWNGFFPGGATTASSADAYPGPFAAPDRSTGIEAGWSPNAYEVSLTVTHDGGRTWRTSQVPGVQNPPSIAAPDNRHWFLLAQSLPGRPLLLATPDGGLTWRELWPAGAPSPVDAVAFASTTAGIGLGVPGDERAVMATRDGAATWGRIGELPDAPATAYPGWPTLALPDTAHAWAVTASGSLVTSSDGGRSWRRVALPPGSGRVGMVAFADASRGCVATGAPGSPMSGELRTTDGGRTWSASTSDDPIAACARGDAASPVVGAALPLTTDAVPDLWFLDDRTAWLLTHDAMWWTADGGATWTGVAWPAQLADYAAILFGAQEAQFVTQTDGWLIAADRSIFHTTDGGRSWAQLP